MAKPEATGSYKVASATEEVYFLFLLELLWYLEKFQFEENSGFWINPSDSDHSLWQQSCIFTFWGS